MALKMFYTHVYIKKGEKNFINNIFTVYNIIAAEILFSLGQGATSRVEKLSQHQSVWSSTSSLCFLS